MANETDCPPYLTEQQIFATVTVEVAGEQLETEQPDVKLEFRKEQARYRPV